MLQSDPAVQKSIQEQLEKFEQADMEKAGDHTVVRFRRLSFSPPVYRYPGGIYGNQRSGFPVNQGYQGTYRGKRSVDVQNDQEFSGDHAEVRHKRWSFSPPVYRYPGGIYGRQSYSRNNGYEGYYHGVGVIS
jgi:hypothetical protein